jgi:hypothetical protein
MTLRNAFEELGLETTLRRILDAVNFARTSSDQLRVVTDTGSTTTISNTVTVSPPAGANTIVAGTGTGFIGGNGPYSTYAYMLSDAREVAREASELHFVQTRNRWTIT